MIILDFGYLKNLISPKKEESKEFMLDLLDAEKQKEYEKSRLAAVMSMLKILYISRLQKRIKECEKEKKEIASSPDYDAEQYARIKELNGIISENRKKRESYRCFFEEPYFARMDLTDDKDGYNSYYIGKRGDEGLEIVDWRAPLARKYYQKSVLKFSINEYNYKLILRRALRVKNAKLLDMQNEYLCLSDYLTQEEIGGRDEKTVFDPFLKDILNSRKEKREICDIIETIQEKQYEIITAPEKAQFAVQGVAGSGKTMIMLHRLSYLMYNDESINPSSVLVITPSDSFNAFIDELSQILELGKVKTVTSEEYYLRLLENVGIDMRGGIDRAPLPDAFLKYAYSDKFVKDTDKTLLKIYDGVHGMLFEAADGEFAEDVLSACDRQIAGYDRIKNSGLRVRRCVLGEIKEKKDGGLYYTKQMRYLFNCVYDLKEFLSVTVKEDRGQFYFYKQLLSFYKSVKFIRRNGEKICAQAVNDLNGLLLAVDKEIEDYKRYKLNFGTDKETYTYADRIEAREQTKKEIEAVISLIEDIKGDFSYACDFADVIRGESYLVRIGKCENTVDMARFFYRETVRKAKADYGADTDKLSPCDPFLLCLVLTRLGVELTPKYSYVFVDEAQDLSPSEYAVLRYVSPRAVFNVFGDLKQNVTGFRGIKDWAQLGFDVYTLNRNYRNTNEIVGFVAEKLGIDMKAIGLGGGEVEFIQPAGIGKFLSGKNGLRAVICSESNLEKFSKKSYNVVRDTGRISKSAVNILTVYESKGLEFSSVAVVDGDLSPNEKYIAYTRALKELAVVK